MNKMRTFVNLLAILVLMATAYYFASAGGFEDATEGRRLRLANGFVGAIKGADEVRIYLLQGTEAQRTGQAFYIDDGYHPREEPICGERVLKGSMELYPLKDYWRALETWPTSHGAMCHHPPYGIRLYDRGKLIYETTICWFCHNFTLQIWPGQGTLVGFDADTKEAQAMLAYLDSLLPYDRRPTKK
jgi:hypothetical protein